MWTVKNPAGVVVEANLRASEAFRLLIQLGVGRLEDGDKTEVVIDSRGCWVSPSFGFYLVGVGGCANLRDPRHVLASLDLYARAAEVAAANLDRVLAGQRRKRRYAKRA